MPTSPENFILPYLKLESFHDYHNLKSNPANRYIYLVHRPDALIPREGFVSPGCPLPINDPLRGHFTGQFNLKKAAEAHVTQWKNRTSYRHSQFLSASFSLAYALFEARRWNERYRCTDTQISIIDPAAIQSDAWLATQLVGANNHDAAYFARWAQEVLILHCIPAAAVVVTMSLDVLLDCIPPWSDEVKPRIRSRELNSTHWVADALAEAARNHADHNPEGEVVVMMQSIEQSIRLLRHTLPSSMKNFDPSMHTRTIDSVARLATLFCWWSKWLIGAPPDAYPPLLQWVRDAVVEQLVMSRKMTRRYKAELIKKRIEAMN
ncbi:hypothetical protein C8R47DRAFT_496473 [Mycena vitilis]|nr:hypothetical protein C8R47DRAFT_496473 [Mycena vitilis]